MTAPRPRCVSCGKAYGRRNTDRVDVFIGKGEQVKPYTGNRRLVREDRHSYGSNRDRIARWFWDGGWWGGYEPFCTLRCALDYARKAYERTKK